LSFCPAPPPPTNPPPTDPPPTNPPPTDPPPTNPPPTNPPPVGGACSGQCGGQAPSGCWCDDLCEGFGDCCEAVCTDCSSLSFCPAPPPPTNPPPTNPPPTDPPPTDPPPTNPPPVGGACSGQCGGQATSGCWCDNLCEGFGDCCEAVCTDCSSLNFCSN